MLYPSGADVSISKETPEGETDIRKFWLRSFVAFNLSITEAFYTHPKILVVGLNGPVVGLSAALVAYVLLLAHSLAQTISLGEPPCLQQHISDLDPQTRRLHIRRAAHLPAHPLQLARPGRRGRCQPRHGA